MDDETTPPRTAGSARIRLRDRTAGLRGLVAVALAGLVLGGVGGAAMPDTEGHGVSRGGAAQGSAPGSG